MKLIFEPKKPEQDPYFPRVGDLFMFRSSPNESWHGPLLCFWNSKIGPTGLEDYLRVGDFEATCHLVGADIAHAIRQRRPECIRVELVDNRVIPVE